jgi:Bacterial TniB protein
MLSDRVAKRQEAAVWMMRETGVRLLIIDDVHNLLSGSRLHQRRLLNLLRWLGNELQIPLVAVGTAEALHAVQSDDQLANRFEPIGLPPWRDGEEYRQLLSTLEAVLPLRRPSQLATPALADKILSTAEGILGEVISIVQRAAVRAVTSGSEAIGAKLIDEIGFISPSQRRRVAV